MYRRAQHVCPMGAAPILQPLDPLAPPSTQPAARLARSGVLVSKRTFQPNNRRRAKTHGFRLRMRTRAGRSIISGRRRKGRARLAA